MKDASFDWKPGFRVGLGYFFACSDWDLQLFWTRLHENTSSHISDPSGGIIPVDYSLSTFFNTLLIAAEISGGGAGSDPTFLLLGTSAHNKWHFNYDTLDFECGKRFFPCSNVLFRPYVGAKAAWIHQKLRQILRM